MFNCIQAKWSEKKPLNLKSFSTYTVKTPGTLKTSVKFNDWQMTQSKITEVADEFRPILGRDLFDQISIVILQKPCPQVEFNNIDPPCTMKSQ